MLPADASMCPGQPETEEAQPSPRQGKLGPQGSTQPTRVGVPQLRATTEGSVLTSHFLPPNPGTQQPSSPQKKSKGPEKGGTGPLSTIFAALCASIIISK